MIAPVAEICAVAASLYGACIQIGLRAKEVEGRIRVAIRTRSSGRRKSTPYIYRYVQC